MAILENAILEQMPGADDVYIEGEYAYVKSGETVTRYLLSKEARRLVLLEREGRPLDIQPGEVTLLVPGEDS